MMVLATRGLGPSKYGALDRHKVNRAWAMDHPMGRALEQADADHGWSMAFRPGQL